MTVFCPFWNRKPPVIYKTLAACGHGHSAMDEMSGKHLPSTYCVPGAAPRAVYISASDLSQQSSGVVGDIVLLNPLEDSQS